MPNPISLFVSFSGGFVTGTFLTMNFLLNKQPHPLEQLMYKKHSDQVIKDLVQK